MNHLDNLWKNMFVYSGPVDFNELRENKYIYIPNSGDVLASENRPSNIGTGGIFIEVFASLNKEHVFQMIRSRVNSDIFVRAFYINWTPWRKI